MADQTAKRFIIVLSLCLFLLGIALLLQGCDQMTTAYDTAIAADVNQVGAAKSVVDTAHKITTYLPIPGKEIILGGLALASTFLARRENKLKKKQQIAVREVVVAASDFQKAIIPEKPFTGAKAIEMFTNAQKERQCDETRAIVKDIVNQA